MNKEQIKHVLFGAAIVAVAIGGCAKDSGPDTDRPDESDRWITISGAMMDDEAGDGNGGTMVYSVTPEQAKNPNVSINVFDNGMHVKSQRTARLQDRKSTRLNSSHVKISYAVFCLKKKTKDTTNN